MNFEDVIYSSNLVKGCCSTSNFYSISYQEVFRVKLNFNTFTKVSFYAGDLGVVYRSSHLVIFHYTWGSNVLGSNGGKGNGGISVVVYCNLSQFAFLFKMAYEK